MPVKRHIIWVTDEKWEAWKALAAERGETISRYLASRPAPGRVRMSEVKVQPAPHIVIDEEDLFADH